MHDSEVRIEEYKLLKQEINSLASMRHQLINILYTSVAAILAFAIMNGEALMFLIAFCVIIPTYLIMGTLSHGIYKIGAYLQVFFDDIGFQWETNLYAFNAINEIKIKRWANSFTLPFVFLGLVSFALFLLYFDWPTIFSIWSMLELVLSLICIISVFVIRRKQDDVDSLKESYIERWCDFQKDNIKE